MEENRENESLIQEQSNVEDPENPKSKKKDGPDRGYSWAVFAAIFWIYFLTGGIIRSSGVLYSELVAMFDHDRTKAAWPSSVATFFLCIACPLAVVFNTNVSNRILTVAGCVIASTAFLLSYLCTTVATLTLVLGVMFGISMGVIAYVPALVISDYFDRCQELAYSIVSISAPFGGVVLPPIVELIISATGLHHFLLYFGLFLITTILAGLLFGKPGWTQEVSVEATTTQNESNLHNSTENQAGTVNNDEHYAKHKLEQSTDTMGRSSEFYNTCKESLNINSVEYYDCLPPSDDAQIPNGRINLGRRVSFASGYQNGGDGTDKTNRATEKVGRKRSNSLQSSQIQQECQQHLETLRDILRCPIFWLITISQMVFMWVFETYLLTIMDYGMDLGLTRQSASYVLSACSLTDIIARLLTGSLSGYAKRRTINGITAFFMGLFCLLAAVSSSIYLVVVVSTLFGLLGGAFGASCVLAYADYIGIEKFSFVLGAAQFIAGIPHLFRPFVIGGFRNIGGSYQGLFYMNGSLGMICGILWFLEPFILRKQRTYESQ